MEPAFVHCLQIRSFAVETYCRGRDWISITIGLIVVGVVTFIPTMTWLGGQSPAEESRIQAQQNVAGAVKMVSEVQYVYDERTGLCFAYAWGGMANGGPVLTVVPYDAVKDHLINPPKTAPPPLKAEQE
jgi:hypothetical protein